MSRPLRSCDDELTLIEKRRRRREVDRVDGGGRSRSTASGSHKAHPEARGAAAAVLKAFSHYQYNVGHRVVLYMYDEI